MRDVLVRGACVVGLSVSALAGGVSTAIAADEVNVYSYRQPFLVEPLFEAFTEETGIKVNVVHADQGLTERLQREGRNSPADVILTVDIGRLDEAKAADVTQAVESETLEANIPEHFRDPEGHWFGLTTRARIIFAAKDRVDPSQPINYEDLADPKWKGRICTRSGKHVYQIGLLASMIAHHGAEEAEKWLAGVKDNLARKPQGGDRQQAEAISQGVCDIALSNSYYYGHMLDNPEQKPWAEAVNVIFPNQDGRGTHVNISGVSLAKHAPNRENAVKLMEFLSSEQAQEIYAQRNYEYPVKPGVPLAELLRDLGEFKVDDLSLATVAEHREEAFRMVDRVGYDQ